MSGGTRRRRLSFEKRKGLVAYVFIAPFLVGLVLFYLTAIGQSIFFSFNKINTGVTGYTTSPVGLQYYYSALFEDPEFIRLEVETLSKLLGEILVLLVYALFIAVMLSKDMKGRGVVRAIFFLPVIISSGILADMTGQGTLGSMTEQAAGADTGLVEQAGAFDVTLILSSLNLSPGFMDFITSAASSISYIVAHSGVQMIIFLAGLQSISPSIYEAAKVEGCTGWESFWKITLPMISPMIPVCTVWTIVEYYLNPSNPIMSKLCGAVGQNDYSFACAMAWLNFLAMAVVVGITMLILSRFVFYENSPAQKQRKRKAGARA